MEKSVSATEAVRRFSEILNSVKYRGASYIIRRGGKPLASLRPVEVVPAERTLGELKELVKRLPRLGPEAEKFRGDLKEILKHQPSVPRDRWA